MLNNPELKSSSIYGICSCPVFQFTEIFSVVAKLLEEIRMR